MKTWQDRLLELLDQSPYKTMTELCRVSGIATSTFSTALKGSHVPKTTTLDKVARVLNTTTQYILNGEENEPPALVHEVPVLDAGQINDWLSLRLKLSTISKRVRTPEPVSKLSFAWIVDTVDMSPFDVGSRVILEPDFTMERRYPKERIFVLASKRRPVVHTVTMTDIDTVLGGSSIEPLPEQPTYETGHHAVLVEFAKTIRGYELLSTRQRSNHRLDFNDYQIVGRVKYSIYYY